MSRRVDIREICGDYALEITWENGEAVTMYFNSRRNAETVKKCIEIDKSVPNMAKAVDFVEVVRCKDCVYFGKIDFECRVCTDVDGPCGVCHNTGDCEPGNGYCYRGERIGDIPKYVDSSADVIPAYEVERLKKQYTEEQNEV
nr:MAG TPA: hypothetical protein [Caudoviricetes sp.]